MIFTAGLAQFQTARQLAQMARDLRADVIDVRKVTKYRRAGFGSVQLPTTLRECRVGYIHAPHLGGVPRSERTAATRVRDLPPAPERALENLARLHDAGELLAHAHRAPHVLLVCHCAAPGDCHRHWTIARPLAARGVDVHHVYFEPDAGGPSQWVVYTARELQRAIDEDDEYACTDLEDFIRQEGIAS